MVRFTVALLSMATGFVGMVDAQNYQPPFRPDTLKDRPVGRLNEVLVVGSAHLSTLPASFKPEMVEPLVQRLVGWRPTAVASENISGLQCDAMRHQRERQAEAVETYCYDPAAAGRAVGLDVTAANAEAERMLANWPDTPSSTQRRRLALVFLAAGEPASATVQWLRLPVAERRPDGNLTKELEADLQARTIRKSETELIAAQLAARSRLDRVWSVDDQSFVGAPIDEKACGSAVEKAWDNPATKARTAKTTALYAGLERPTGLLDLYRALNEPSYASQAYKSDWGAALNRTLRTGLWPPLRWILGDAESPDGSEYSRGARPCARHEIGRYRRRIAQGLL